MFANHEILDLSSCGISSLLGLNLLNLSSLKQIILRDNQISVITEEVAQKLSAVENLDLSNNSFQSIDLSLYTNLTNLNLSYNSIKRIDLSMPLNQNTAINVNLMSNQFTSHTQITLDSEKNYNLNLIYNKLTDVQSDFFVNNNVDVYIQNNINLTLTNQDTIKIFDGYSMPQFNIKILNSEQQVIDTICANSEKRLEIGDYTLKFYNADTALYNSEDLNTYAYNDINISVIPTKPTYQIYQDDVLVQDVSKLTFSKPIKINFSDENNSVIKISLNNQAFITSNTVELTEKRIYKITVICENNNKQSQPLTLYITIKDEVEMALAVVIILVLSAFVAIIVALKFYANKQVNFNKKDERK